MPDAHRDEIAKLESLYSDHPEGRIFTHLAEAYRKGGELDRAREILEQGIQLHPDYASAHVVRGRVLMDQGEPAEAVAAFEQVLKLDTHNLVALRAMGDLARTEGRRQDAEDYYERLLEVEPADQDVLEALEDLRSSPAAQEPTAGSPAGQAFSEPDFSEPELAESDFGESDFAEPELQADLSGSESEAEVEGLEGLETLEGFGDSPAADQPAAAADEPEAPSTSPGVMTETIAQVYARQGLYDRAAEVYRELVRERPNEPALRSRLEEMEALAAQSEGGPAGLEPALESGPPVESGPDRESGQESGQGREPGLEVEPWEEVEAGDPAQALEGLEPMELEGADVAPEPMEGLEVDEVDPETGLAADVTPSEDLPDTSDEMGVRDVPEPPEEAPWARDLPAEEPWATDLPEEEGPAGGDDEPWATDAPFQEVPAEASELPGEQPTEAESESESEAGSVWAGGDWDAPETETPYAWGETEPEADTSQPIQTYFQGLLGWHGATGASEAAPDQKPSSGAASEGAPEGGDDDLEMFQSWLESLKQ